MRTGHLELDPPGAPIEALVADSGGPGAAPEPVPVISEASREALLTGLGAPAGKKAVTKGRGKKAQDPQGVRDPVEGTLLRPGAPPEACQMELL